MSYRSGSEGKIRESDTTKATTAPRASKTTSVNRRLRDALSPSPDGSPQSPSPPPARNRDRSRSPYRADRPPRDSLKRRRPDDYRNESWRGDHRPSRGYDGGRRPSLEDSRREHPRSDGRTGSARDTRTPHDGRGERDGHGSKRRRTRSRSPGTSDTGRRDAPLSSGLSVRFERESQRPDHQDSRARRFSRGSANEEQHGSGQDMKDRNNTNESSHSTMQQGSGQGEERIASKLGTVGGEEQQTAEATQTAEVLSIEERRKRREAIKAKYSRSATPLLVQALQQDSAPASPASQVDTQDTRSERSASPSMFTPETPQGDSVAGSPPAVVINDDAELANSTGPGDAGDEPSAADYDPAADMAEDRAKDKRYQEPEISASSYDETQQHDQRVLLPESIAETRLEQAAKITKPADDMFASDDEDDMFALAAPTKSTNDGEPSRAVAIPTAKELDQSLLDNWDDPEGYYRIILGELLEGRYHVQANLGKGMFSSVVRAMDSTTGQLVAIKVIRNNETMIKAATKEMEILEKLAEADPEDKKHLIRLERSFTHKGHMCMVFEHMSINLREVLKKFGRDIGINLKAVRSYAQQIFLALSLLRKCNILHADLKPDNILVNDARSMLKVCDLGSAADASENEITPYLVSRFYRAPEIILGIPYDFAIDMWSIGCTLFELYTGKILFTGRTNNQMLRSIMECRGKFSLKMLKKAEFGAVHFEDVSLNFRSVERDKVTGRDVTKLISFAKPTRDLKSRLLAAAGGTGSSKKAIPEAELKEVNLFADLLDRCLTLNPDKRITPNEALKHPFIHRNIPVPSSVTRK